MTLHPLPPTLMYQRLARNGVIVLGLLSLAIAIGALGYHYLDDLPWLDAALNAAMILTGMGPVNAVVSAPAKVFAIFYAVFSGFFFLKMAAVLLAPAVKHFLHRFHLELAERSESKQVAKPSGGAAPGQRK